MLSSTSRSQNLTSSRETNPGWHVVFDADPVVAEAGRRKLFERAVAENITVTGYHWGFPGAGTIAKQGSGYALVPAKA